VRGLAGAVSLETLGGARGFVWPDAMPDYDTDPEAYRRYQDATLKPFGLAVGRLLATADNPRGYPDVVVERAGQDTLGTSTFLARPFTGAVVYVEPSEGRRFSFYAPNVWMHGKRVLHPTFSVLGSHLSNAHQDEECAPALPSSSRSSRSIPRPPTRWAPRCSTIWSAPWTRWRASAICARSCWRARARCSSPAPTSASCAPSRARRT